MARSRRRRKKVVQEEDSYLVDMEIKPDEKGFSLDVYSREPMSTEEIVLVIEEWLSTNIMQGFHSSSDTRH